MSYSVWHWGAESFHQAAEKSTLTRSRPTIVLTTTRLDDQKEQEKLAKRKCENSRESVINL